MGDMADYTLDSIFTDDAQGYLHGNIKHGGKGARLYTIWVNMKQRILNSKNKAYKNYGGRGITICDEWLEFIPFRDWALSNGYAENLTIDRKDPNKSYYPKNCQWIIRKENSRKLRTNKINMQIANEIRELYATGKYTHQQLADKYNVSRRHIGNIINKMKWYDT